MTTTSSAPTTSGRSGTSNVPLASIGLALGVLLSVLDQTIVAIALPAISADLKNFDSISWIVTAYVLASTATGTLYGRLSDRFGRRNTFIVAMTLFTVASALCGQASSMGELIFYRAVQGIGAGALFAIPTIALAELFPERLRGRVIGLLGAIFAIATLGGPLAGGVITDTAGWRWIFYINLPLGILSIVLVAMAVRIPRTDARAGIDILGSALLASAVVAIMLVAEWGGREHSWTSGLVLGLIAASVALFGLFGWWEGRAGNPLLPLSLLTNTVMRIVLPTTVLLGALLYSMVVFLPTYFQAAHGMSPIEAGLALNPCVAAFVAASALSGWRAASTGRYKRYLVAGGGLIVIGFTLFAQIEAGSSYFMVTMYSTIAGIGVGFLLQLLVVVAQNAVEPGLLSAATSAVLSVRGLGMALGVGFFANILVRRLDGKPPTAGNLSATIPDTFVYGVPLAVLLFVLTLAIPRRSASGEQPSAQGKEAEATI
ncbi:MDR family MFS transporter [Actinomadura sp. 3N508]|uniref:MDR family MFS transporter n=1 Tax=Actinomadura sp. 3N508 TaxID=3375153 RepID=UPI003799018A